MKRTTSNLLKAILIIGIIISFCGTASGLSVSEDQQSKWVDFKSKYGENWKVLWSDKTGTPTMIYGSHYNIAETISDNEDAERIALKIISENKDLLGIDDVSNIELFKAERGNGEWYVDYRQYYKGLPVVGGSVGLTLSDKAGLASLGSDFYPNINLDVNPKVSKNNAITIAKKEFGNPDETKEVVLVVLPIIANNTSDYHLAWKVELLSENPLSGETFFVDAFDGTVIHKYSNIVSGSDLNAVGRTSLPNNAFQIIAFSVAVVVLLFLVRRKSK